MEAANFLHSFGEFADPQLRGCHPPVTVGLELTVERGVTFGMSA